MSNWQKKYAKYLRVADAFVVIWALAGAYVIRFGVNSSDDLTPKDTAYFGLSAALAVTWWLMLDIWGTRESKVLGLGTEEYKRVLTASAWLFGFVAIISYALRIDTARGFVGLAFPVGAIGLVTGRWLLREHLRAERKRGKSIIRALIIGGPQSSAHLVSSLHRAEAAGYLPVAAHIPGGNEAELTSIDIGVPVSGLGPTVESIMSSIRRHHADVVAISAGVRMSPKEIRRLGWELAAVNVGMILAPALTDVAGPRIHTQPVAGLPLIHVSTPKLTGGRKVAKRAFDLATASLLVLVLSPLFLAIALIVKFTSPGPVFYVQERIGLRGQTFFMYKFRSMRTDADEELTELLKAQGSDGKPLFKVENDPRITRVGRTLRKLSLDELPQLINVIQGSMSLVGPRPQRAGEVALYDDAAHRRLYVSPGMSGLWQVSGRSDLSWEESIRLDLYYVENWSLTADVVILLKTFRAVLRSKGAV